MDLDQIAPTGAVWSGSTLFVRGFLNISADEKTNNWCFKA